MITGELDPRWIGAIYRQQSWHLHRQLLRRYRIVLGPGEYSRIKRDLRTGRALLIENRTDGAAIYSVKIASAGERVYVLVHREQIVTAWPRQRRLNEIYRRLRASDALVAEKGPGDATAGERFKGGESIDG